jgi:hypothetical protein
MGKTPILYVTIDRDEFLKREASRSWVHKVGDATSQWVNATVLRGEPNESISGRAYQEGWYAKWWIDMVLGSQHCREAWVMDIWRAAMLVERHGGSINTRLCRKPCNAHEDEQ